MFLYCFYSSVSSNPSMKGTIPGNIGTMKKLKCLLLSNSGLTGRIPDSFSKLESLVYLFVLFFCSPLVCQSFVSLS